VNQNTTILTEIYTIFQEFTTITFRKEVALLISVRRFHYQQLLMWQESLKTKWCSSA